MIASHIAEETNYRAHKEVLDLVREFEACTLPGERWTHAAHLTVALWYLLQHDWHEAVMHMRDAIKGYNEACGIVTTRQKGYHETLTLFWLRVVRAFLGQDLNEGRSLVSLSNELIATAEKNLPLKFYTRELLFSWEARAEWVEPDLQANLCELFGAQNCECRRASR